MKIFTNVIASPVRAKQSIFGRLVFALVFACIFIACGDESSSSAPAPDPADGSSSSVAPTSNDEDLSSSSQKSSGKEKSSSSVEEKSSSSEQGYSSVNNKNSSSSVVELSSSSMRRRCEEGTLDTMILGDLIGFYECRNNTWELISYEQSSSSDAHYDMTEQFYCDGSSECECASEDFTDPRDNQVYKTINVYTKDADRNTIVAYRVFAEN